MADTPKDGDAAKATERLVQEFSVPGISDALKATGGDNVAKLAKELSSLGISDGLKTAFGHTSQLTSSLGEALAHLRATPAPELPYLEPPRNPILDTNEQLAELSRTTKDLVGIAQKQAELAQSLTETSQLALVEAIRSGKQAKIATRLAAAGIIATVIIAIATMYYNYRRSQAAEAHFRYQIQVLSENWRAQRAAADSHSQDELRALGEIFRAMQNSKNVTPSSPRKPKLPPKQ